MIVFSGCSDMQKPVNDLLSPPKLPMNMEKIKVLINSVYDEISYIIPLSGKNTNSVQFIDIDGDGSDELFLFHKVANSNKPLRVLVLSKDDNGAWIFNDEIRGVGFGINMVEYEDVDLDGVKEIFIGWQVANNKNKALSVYKYVKNKEISIQKVFENVYTQFCIGDLIGNGKKQLIIIEQDITEGMAMATMYDHVFNYVDDVVIEGVVDKYYSIKVDHAIKNKQGCFIDSIYGNGVMITELLVFDGQLINVFYDDINKTTRIINRISKDIDLDGVIDIPKVRMPYNYNIIDFLEGDSSEEWITTWYNWNGDNGLYFNTESYINSRLGFEFVFPSDWKQNMQINVNNNIVRISYMDAYTKEITPVIEFTAININDIQDISNKLEGDMMEIARGLEYVYYVRLLYDKTPNNREVSIDLKRIKHNFKVFDYID